MNVPSSRYRPRAIAPLGVRLLLAATLLLSGALSAQVQAPPSAQPPAKQATKSAAKPAAKHPVRQVPKRSAKKQVKKARKAPPKAAVRKTPKGKPAPSKKPVRTKRASRTARPAKVLAPAVVDSFRTIVLTTCPKEEGEEIWKGSMREEMAQWLAVRYKRAGVTMAGVDCSGFIKTLFRKALSLDLPHSAASQSRLGEPVDTSELSFGDLLFFRNKKRISHVGIYIGDGYFIHSSRTFGVRIDSLFGTPYYAKRYAKARRLTASADPSSAGE